MESKPNGAEPTFVNSSEKILKCTKGDEATTAESSNEELKVLICENFGLPETAYLLLRACGVDMDNLALLTEKDLVDIFPTNQIGTRAKFRYHLNVWKERRASMLSTIATTKEWVQRHYSSSSQLSAQDSVLSPSTSSVAAITLNKSKFKELLAKSERGKEIVKYYQEHDSLNETHRKALTTIIVDHYSLQNVAMGMNDILLITKIIKDIFPLECSDYYFMKRGRGKNPVGKLYDKAVNARVKIRKIEKSLSADVSQTGLDTKSKANNLNIKTKATDDEAATIIWLSRSNGPWSEVEVKWTQVVNIRKNDILTEGDNVLTKWPLFKHSLGHTLVEIDYNINFPKNTSELYTKWPMFKKDVIPYFEQNIKDKSSRNLLNALKTEIDNNTQDCIIFMLLHSIFQSPIVSTPSESKISKWKPSIIDCQESTLLHCTSIGEYREKVEKLKNKFVAKGLTFQPIIIAVGTNLSDLECFFTYYDGILYKFPSFLKCLDITFKLFQVMNFNYPIEGKNVFCFIENYFYNFKTAQNSNVIAFINFLVNKLNKT